MYYVNAVEEYDGKILNMKVETEKNRYDVIYKILFIGDSGVGKTAMIQRYKNRDIILPDYLPTVGIDFRLVDLVLDDVRVRVQLWDTVGQERYRTMTTNFFRGANGVLLLFDVTNRETFRLVATWVKSLKDKDLDKEEVFLIGNKIDLHDRREVSFREGKQLAVSYGFKYFETSAKTGEHVDNVIQHLVQNVHDSAMVSRKNLEDRTSGSDSERGERGVRERPKSIIVLGKSTEEKTMSKTRTFFRRFCKLL